jgi:transcriptional regulator with XRE-family HTH domain
MPRTPSRPAPPHPLRQLRDGLAEVRGQAVTQAVLARELGVSASLVNAIEAGGARAVSDDLRARIATHYGVRLGGAGGSGAGGRAAARPVCMAFPELPLAEGLRRAQAEQSLVEDGALFAFDAYEVTVLRAALLAAHRAKKASIFLHVLTGHVEEIVARMRLGRHLPAAQKDIKENHGQFPPGIVTGPAAVAYSKAFVAAHGTPEKAAARNENSKTRRRKRIGK